MTVSSQFQPYPAQAQPAYSTTVINIQQPQAYPPQQQDYPPQQQAYPPQQQDYPCGQQGYPYGQPQRSNRPEPQADIAPHKKTAYPADQQNEEPSGEGYSTGIKMHKISMVEGELLAINHWTIYQLFITNLIYKK